MFTIAPMVSSSTAAKLRDLQPRSTVADVQVRDAATHKAPGRSQPSCKVERWLSRLRGAQNNQFLRTMAMGRMTRDSPATERASD